MDTTITNYLSKLELGELQQFKNMGIIPLFASINRSPEYLTLKEALEKRLLIVTEISHGGSVPELKVANKAETIIPVSCTEQGRWSYVSEEFAEAGVVASPKVRMAKAASVAESLERSETFESDQAALWGEIEEMAAHAAVRSPTSAMEDIYKSKIDELDEYLKTFKYVLRQKGLLVFINGEVTGFDVISSEPAYKTLYLKLVKSYAMDALLQKKEKNDEPSVNKAKAFLEEITVSKEKKYKSIGHGWDYRFEGKAIVCSALVYRKKVIHTAFFRTTESDKAGRISGYRRRRDFRI